MEVFAVLAFGTEAACEEETEVGAGDFVGFGVAAVEGDVAAAFGLVFGGEGVFTVAAGPFVVPSKSALSACAGACILTTRRTPTIR